MDLSFLNKIFDKVFLITLEHDFDEKNFIENANLKPTGKNRLQRFKERMYNLEYEIFYGVDGSKCSFENVIIDKNGYNIVKPQNLTFGQIGCSMSHVKLYELISKGDWDKVLILEDDCVFLPEILNFENYYSQVPQNWQVLYLGYDGFNTHQGNISSNVYEVSKNNFTNLHCTHSIGIRKDTAKIMSEFNKDCFYTADGAYSEYIKQKNGITHAIVPKLSVQELADCVSYEIDLKYKNLK